MNSTLSYTQRRWVMTALRHIALSFDGGEGKTKHAHVRGGKGMSLAEMVGLGLPVPPGFTLATAVSRAYQQHGTLPRRAVSQVIREIQALEKATGRRFGDSNNPLLVSVRSGAKQSMPGMMDTILNVGLTRSTGLIRMGGETFARNVQERLQEQWKSITGQHTVPSSPYEQLFTAIEAVLASWRSERAVAYRSAHGISHSEGTAVNVQQMVFGNIDQNSCTGVVFSANPVSGEATLYGEFLRQAQGEDVVSGTRQTQPIAEFAQWNGPLAAELEMHVNKLEEHLRTPVDVEFTVEQDTLYLLQVRPAKLTPTARIVHTVQKVWRTPRAQRAHAKQLAVESIPLSAVDSLLRPALSREATTGHNPVYTGTAASPGAVVGRVAYTILDALEFNEAGEQVVLMRDDTSPHDLPGMLASKAIVTRVGGPGCHAAIVARDIGIPAVVGVDDKFVLHHGETVTVCGDSGAVYRGALPLSKAEPPHEATLLKRWIQESLTFEPRLELKFLDQRTASLNLLADLYLTDAMAQAARGTTLEIEAAKLRATTHRTVAEWLAAYLFVAVAAECRHYRSAAHSTDSTCDNAANYVNRRIYTMTAASRSAAQTSAVTYASTCSVKTLSELVRNIMVMFGQASWDAQYGGAMWEAIAKCLWQFLAGEISHSVFADQAFDLRHNGGVLFDKHATIIESNHLQSLLDEKKRSDSPTYLWNRCKVYGAQVSPSVKALWQAGVQQSIWKETGVYAGH